MSTESHATAVHSIVAGLLSGVFGHVVLPAFGVMSEALHILIPTVTAFFGGIAYAAGADLWRRLQARKTKPEVVIKDKDETP